MELSIVIPAYNEEKQIEKSLAVISEYLKKRYTEYEVIVVDDGSSDRTRRIAKELTTRITNLRMISNSENTGKGYSVKRGVSASRGDLILFTDVDLSTPIEELERLKEAVQGNCDIAIGSRALRDSIILKRQNIIREYMGKVFNIFVRIYAIKGIKDTQCGFKLFKRKAAMEIFSRQKINGFSFDVEILYIAKKLGYKIKTVPITWSNSPDSKVKLFFSSLNMFLDLRRIKRLHRDL